MSLDFRIHRFEFPAKHGAAQTLSTTLHFPSPVRHVMPAISGFKIEYVKEDHELGEMTIDTVTTSTARRLMSPFAPSF